jgi:hypothetical protein
VQRVETESALAVRRSTLLLGVALDKLRVEVERDPRWAHSQHPRLLAGSAARRADRRQLPGAQGVQQPRRGRMRSNSAEQVGLVSERAEIRDAITAIDQHRCEIDHGPAGIVDRLAREQVRQPHRQLTLKPQPSGQLRHERRPRPRHQRALISANSKRSDPAAMLHPQGASSLCSM